MRIVVRVSLLLRSRGQSRTRFAFEVSYQVIDMGILLKCIAMADWHYTPNPEGRIALVVNALHDLDCKYRRASQLSLTNQIRRRHSRLFRARRDLRRTGNPARRRI